MHHHHYQYYHNRYHYSDHRNFPEKRSDDDEAAENHPRELLIQGMVTCNAVVVFSLSTCSLCHVIKRLFRGMGVNPAVYELDEYEYPIGKELETALMRLLRATGTAEAPPVVFVGGRLVGGIDRVLGSHISGTLVPLLKEAGALWL